MAEALGLGAGVAARRLAAELTPPTLAHELRAELPALAVRAAARGGEAEPLAHLAQSPPPLIDGDSGEVCRALGVAGAAATLRHHLLLATLARVAEPRLAELLAQAAREGWEGAAELATLAEPGYLAVRRRELWRRAEGEGEDAGEEEGEDTAAGTAGTGGVGNRTAGAAAPRRFTGDAYRLFADGRGFDFRWLEVHGDGSVVLEMEGCDAALERLLGGDKHVLYVVSRESGASLSLQGCRLVQQGMTYRLQCRPEAEAKAV